MGEKRKRKESLNGRQGKEKRELEWERRERERSLNGREKDKRQKMERDRKTRTENDQ